MEARTNCQHNCMACLATLIVLASLLVFTGCGKKGIPKYGLSGQVTYDGKPVPKGYLRFAPDKKKGNSGPGSSATINDGHYETMNDRGTVAGPHIVSVTGTDGIAYKTETGVMIPIGRPLFPEFKISIDIPKEAEGVHDFDIPVFKKKRKR